MQNLYIRQLFVAIFALLCSVTVTAHDFEVDGIYYNITDKAKLTVEVTEGDNNYKGEVIIPETVDYENSSYSVTSIGESAFDGCHGLTSVTIGNSVTSIGKRAFNDCTSLKDLRIEDGETTLSLGYNYYNSFGIAEGLFYDCPLESLYLGRNIEYKTGYDYGWSPFCRTTLKSVTIGNSVKSIGKVAFFGCSSLKTVTIPQSVTSIGAGAFNDCDGLTSIEIPNSVTSIGGSAFYDCDGLTSIEIPNCVKSIGEDAFYSCSSLTSFHISDLDAWCKIDFVNYNSNPLCNANNLYLNGELVKELVVPNSVTSIGNYAFCGCDGLTSVTIGDSVTSIGDNAFYSCRSLTSVTIGNSVTSIGESAFSGCYSLTSVTIGNSVKSIGRNAFLYCRRPIKVELNCDSVGDWFSGVECITEVVIGNSVTSIGYRAFANCYSLKSLTIGNSVTSIGESAFTYCGLRYVTLNCKKIGSWFGGSETLEEVVIGDGVTSIEKRAFAGCYGLRSVKSVTALQA